MPSYPTDNTRRRKGYSRRVNAIDIPINPISGLSATTVQEAISELHQRNQPLMDWRFTEGSGDKTYDSANSNRAPATLVGTPGWEALAGTDMYALVFNGTTDYVTLPNDDKTDINFTTEEFTFACWFTTNNDDYFGYLISTANNYDNGWRCYIQRADGVTATYRDALLTQYNNPTANGVVAATDTWYFYASVWTSDDVLPYFNGALSIGPDPDNRPQPIPESTTPLLFGRRTGGGLLNGKLSHPRIWGRVLTADEILALFNDEKSFYGL